VLSGTKIVNIREILGMAPVIPVLTVAEIEHAAALACALAAGGLRVLEITLRTPVALAAVAAMRKAVPEAIIGVGTLTRSTDFAAADQAGAQFGVTPGLTAELAAAARAARFPLLPGVMTPTELISAREAGFNVLKLFPAQQAGGIGMLQALGALFPNVQFCPTGGITRASAAEYLALPNVISVGGSWVAPAPMIASGNWSAIEALARDAASLASRTIRHRAES
jgi:2-dehydro-3-deoxyphosphogluconate aldolase/(4S)-4-hydroxy-2-oxoglutarate aldolase